MNGSRLLVVLLVLAGCGAGGFKGRFTQACNESGEGSEEFCSCMADAADENLSDDQKEFVLANMEGDQDRVAELQEEMGMEGAMAAGEFMSGAFECAAEEAERQEM